MKIISHLIGTYTIHLFTLSYLVIIWLNEVFQNEFTQEFKLYGIVLVILGLILSYIHDKSLIGGGQE